MIFWTASSIIDQRVDYLLYLRPHNMDTLYHIRHAFLSSHWSINNCIDDVNIQHLFTKHFLIIRFYAASSKAMLSAREDRHTMSRACLSPSFAGVKNHNFRAPYLTSENVLQMIIKLSCLTDTDTHRTVWSHHRGSSMTCQIVSEDTQNGIVFGPAGPFS